MRLLWLKNSIWCGVSSWNFRNNFTRNVAIFGIDNRFLIKNTDNRKNNILLTDERAGNDINDNIGTAGTKFNINFTKANTKFFLSLYHNGYGSYLYVNKAGTCKFKVHDNIPWYKFCLGSLSKDFIKDELSKVSLNSFIYDFSVDQNEDMAYICEYLMKKKDIKECSNLLN